MAVSSEVNFQVNIKSGREPVDMEFTLETLDGFSGALTIIANAVLSESVSPQMSEADKVRTQLMGAYIGSYVQDFKVKITDPVKVKKLNSMGNAVLSDVISYFLNESTYTEPKKMSAAASKVIKNMERYEDQVLDRIFERVKKMHKISKMKGYTVSLHRKTDLKSFKVIDINQKTAENIFSYVDDPAVEEIEAIITRFNLFTGNGRGLFGDDNATVPFCFLGNYKKVPKWQTKLATENLHNNNGLDVEDMLKLKLKVKIRRNISGEVIKYYIESIEKP